MDDDGIVHWNRGSEELYGFSRDEVLGQRKELLLRTEVPGSSFEALRAERDAFEHQTFDRRQVRAA